MPADARSLLLQWLLPAVAGLGTGICVMAPGGNGAAGKTQPAPPLRPDAVKLPEDPVVIRLAALAGRTGDAQVVIEAMLAAGAGDPDLAEWLAPVLIADPAWLERFIPSVPGERQVDLARAALWTMSELSPDSVWELIRSSPFAAQAARAAGRGEHEGLDVISTCKDSPRAAEVLFDPANGFSNEEIAGYFRWGSGSVPNCRRILEEWAAGRWEGASPECVRSAWLSLRREDREVLQEFEESVPAPLQEETRRFEALAQLMQPDGEIAGNPPASELRILDAQELAEFTENRAEAARPLPLATLAALPQELRGQALENYFNHLFPFQTDRAKEAVGSLDQLALTRAEKQTLLEAAAHRIWNAEGHHETALQWIARMPDRKARATAERNLLEELAKYDPEGALAFAKTMPEGALREEIEQLATGNLP